MRGAAVSHAAAPACARRTISRASTSDAAVAIRSTQPTGAATRSRQREFPPESTTTSPILVPPKSTPIAGPSMPPRQNGSVRSSSQASASPPTRGARRARTVAW
jgi:hypothetical protein